MFENDIEEIHYRTSIKENEEVRDLVFEANLILERLRDSYGPDLSRRSALELLGDKSSGKLSAVVEDLAFVDEIVANYWIDIADHDLTGDWPIQSDDPNILGLNDVGRTSHHGRGDGEFYG